MTEKCAVCGADIDFDFNSIQMNDFAINSIVGNMANIDAIFCCHYCGVKFNKKFNVDISLIKKYSDDHQFDR